MIDAVDFLDRYETKIQEFIQSFNRLLYTAMEKLKTRFPHEATVLPPGGTYRTGKNENDL